MGEGKRERERVGGRWSERVCQFKMRAKERENEAERALFYLGGWWANEMKSVCVSFSVLEKPATISSQTSAYM